MVTGNVYRNSGEVGHVVSEICMWTDRQTDRQTDRTTIAKYYMCT